MVPIEEPTRGTFSMYSGFKAYGLYAHRKALAPIYWCVLALHIAEAQAIPPAQCALSIASFPVLFWVLFSLPSMCGEILSVL